MKKLSYTTIILAAACLLLPGCSDDAADAIEQPVTPPTAELVGDSEVEIRLSSNSSSMVTRAGVYQPDSKNENVFYTTNWMGIFCLAEEKLVASADDIDWSRSSTTYDDVRLDNVGAKVTGGELNFTSTTPYFYPISNWYKYQFYGYYTHQSSTVTKEKDKVTIGITFKGNDDILWGKSEKPSDTYEQYAYSAKYYREHIKAKSTAAIPSIGFKHVMTCLEFEVEGMDGNAESLTITSIKLLDAPEKLNLILATKSHTGEGIIEKDETSTSTVSVDLKDVEYAVDEEGNFTATSAANVTNVSIVNGQSNRIGSSAAFYAFPQQNHTIRVAMKSSNGTFTYDMPVKLPDGDTYAGHKYKLKLQVYGPQEISLTATLTPWEYDAGTDDDIFVEL